MPQRPVILVIVICISFSCQSKNFSSQCYFLTHCICIVLTPNTLFTCSQCLQECRDGMYGLNCTNSCWCDKRAVCSKDDGTCSCMAPGVTGVLCDMPCSGGTYGRNCALKCSCHNGASCDRFNGMSSYHIENEYKRL